jgi:uncharacterized protein DUF6114
MDAQDDPEVHQPNDDTAEVQPVPEGRAYPHQATQVFAEQTEITSSRLLHGWQVNSTKLIASLHKIRLTSRVKDEAVPIPLSKKGRHKAQKNNLQDWDTWSKFRLWRCTRPLWGSLLMFLGALIMLALPLSLLRFAFLLDSLWASTLIGALLLVMALAQLFVPSYSVLTGSIGIVLSLVSFITSSFGGLVIGMLLGIIGGALSLSWRPVKRSRLMASRSTAAT